MAPSRNTLKQLGRGIALVGVAVVAWAGWLKADNDSLGVFLLLVVGGVIWTIGSALIRYGKAEPDRGGAPAPDDPREER